MATPATSAPSTLSSPPTMTTTRTDRPKIPMAGEMPPMAPTTTPATAAIMAATDQDRENTRGTLMPMEYAAGWSDAVARSATPPRQYRNTSSTAVIRMTVTMKP